MTRRFKSSAGLFTVMLLAACSQAQGKPLTTQECTGLVAEHAELSGKSIEKLMDQDPAEAKQKLKPGELAEIERFLFVEGQIRFRCPAVKLKVPPLPEVEVRQAANDTGPDESSPETVEKKEQAEEGPSVPFPVRNPKRR